MRLCFLKQANYWEWKLYALFLEEKMEKWIGKRFYQEEGKVSFFPLEMWILEKANEITLSRMQRVMIFCGEKKEDSAKKSLL